MNLTNEQLAKLKETESAEELLALARENGMAMTEDDAKRYFEMLHKEGELADEELENVAGGICDTGNHPTNKWHDGTYFYNLISPYDVNTDKQYGFTANNDNGWVVGKVTQIYKHSVPVIFVRVHSCNSYYSNVLGDVIELKSSNWTAYTNAQDSNGRTICPYSD